MAIRRGNGNGHGGKTGDAMLEVLKAIHADLGQTNARLGSVEEVLRGHGRQLEALHVGQGEIRGELRQVNDRLDNIRDLAGERYRSLEARVSKLETA